MPTTSDIAESASYTPLAKTFHWILAALMALMFITIWVREESERGSPERAFWTDAHTSLGILIFVLTITRLIARTPMPPPLGSELARKAAKLIHGLLYLVTVLVPVSGFLRMTAKDRVTNFFGIGIPSPTGVAPFIYEFAKALHGELMQYIVLLLIGLHVMAALWHHFIMKDATLRRMT
jgi:superoxide oxidase